MKRTLFDIVGTTTFRHRTTSAPIGHAVGAMQSSKTPEGAFVVLNLSRPPSSFDKTFLVPHSANADFDMSTPLRVCEWTERPDGGREFHGLGMLEPTTHPVSDAPYFELVADQGHLFWTAGHFIARTDPHSFSQYYTPSEAA